MTDYTYTPEAHAAALTDSELYRAISDAPVSAMGSPLHRALIAERYGRIAFSAPMGTGGY